MFIAMKQSRRRTIRGVMVVSDFTRRTPVVGEINWDLQYGARLTSRSTCIVYDRMLGKTR